MIFFFLVGAFGCIVHLENSSFFFSFFWNFTNILLWSSGNQCIWTYLMYFCFSVSLTLDLITNILDKMMHHYPLCCCHTTPFLV